MSALSGPRGSRGSRLTTRGRANYSSRGNRAGHEDYGARRARAESSLANAVTAGPSRPSSRTGPPRGPARRANPRGHALSRPTARQPRSHARTSPLNSTIDALRNATTQDQSVYKKYMETTFTTLGEHRKQERKDAIADGTLADPDKPTTLANAITIVGTCQHMCAEYERAQRIVQFMVDNCEKVQHSQENIRVPSEDRMVKRYRRPAAGYEEQLPSDIRPPLILQKTLDYLMDEIVGGPEPLSNVHKFVWDRTRAIRNDFSIQQVTKVEELRIAISCFERIARFHILSLHQLAGTSENSVDFDAYQEREQLNNTLLSLIYYYDDSRHRLVSPNEAEFRAYCIIFEIQDQRPDLEDRAQNWPVSILKDHRVQTALKLYAAAASSSDPQGPLRPQALHAVAQANTPLFFNIVKSPAVPYLMACVAEIYFNKVRRMAIDTIWKAYKTKRGGSASIEDWSLSDVANALGFDDEEQAQAFCEEHGLTVAEREGGEAYVDLGSVTGRYLSDANTRRKQPFSFNLVEQKRRGRTLPATINGLTAAQAQAQGLVIEDNSDNETSSANNDESLFIPDQNGSNRLAQEPTLNGVIPNVTSMQEEGADVGSKTSPLFQINPSAPSFIASEKPHNTTTGIGFFGKPSGPVLSQPTDPVAAPSFNTANPASYSPFSDLNNPETKPSPFSKLPNPVTIPGPSSNLEKPDTTPGLFSNANKQDSTVPTSTSSALTSQAHQGPPSMASSSRSIFDHKFFSNANSTKVSFETSPLFSQSDLTKSTRSDKKDEISAFSSALSAQPAVNDSRVSGSPFGFLNHPKSVAPPATILSPAANANVEKASAQRSLPHPFLSSLPPSTPASGSPFQSTQQPAQPDTGLKSDFAKPITTPSTKSMFPEFKHAVIPPEQPIDHSKPATATPNFRTQHLTSTNLQPSHIAAEPQKPTVAIPPPDPRPAVLDALAESLMMDDQGLLQQFIEYTVGPIVHHAFLDVEDDRSWNRAREIRTALLSRKYLRRWKDNVWTKKLLRKGKERRATFARSMQQMARSSRQRQNHSGVGGNDREPGTKSNNVPISSNMGPPALPKSEVKRKSLPTDLEADGLPNAETAFSNKRKRQEPPAAIPTPSTKQSLRTSFQLHHKRSRTVGDSQRPRSVYGGLADFSHLDENTYDNEQLLQQARRLVGHAKLDTTRGDYFALKSRGIDPDTPLLPQTGIKRSRVDEQISRVQKLLKPSSPSPPQSFLSGHSSGQNNVIPSQDVRVDPCAAIPTGEKRTESPGDLLAQIREVREALAEGTAWFQAEREKSERLSSSRSSEVPPNASIRSQAKPQSQPPGTRPQQWRPMPTRAQIRLERTRVNGLLAPDWDWNKSVTEWKLRGGTGSPRASASRDQSGTTTPATSQQKKPIGFAAVTNGLGRRPVRMTGNDDKVYDDQDERSDEGEDLMNGGAEDEERDYPETYEGVYGNGQGSEDEEDEDKDDIEEDEEADDLSPERVELQGQGSSADTAIDLD
ncbi:MAG: hypothetical protein Q9226_001458 [Calogaya cf. arnoldii]